MFERPLSGARAENRSDYGEHVCQDSADAFPRRCLDSRYIQAHGPVQKHGSALAARTERGRAALPETSEQQRGRPVVGAASAMARCRYATTKARATNRNADV